MYPKIDIYVNSVYVCSTERAENCKIARDNFLKNPQFAGIGPNGINIIKLNPEDIYTVRCEYSDKKE